VSQPPGAPAGRRPVTARRLSLGWRQAGRPAALAEHRARYGPLPAAGRAGSQQDLIEAVDAASLTGRGGAGFPTAVKMRAVARRRGPAVVIANGMESEPASQKDQALLAQAPHLVLDGAVLAARAVGADTVHLCLDRSRTRQASAVLRAIGERQAAQEDPVQVIAHQLPRHYVSSEETSLVSWLNGGQAKPAATPPRPFERGVRGRPTLVDNVETLAHVALIARFGPAWFRETGCPDAPGTMLVTVGGAVRAPGVYEIEAGARIGDVLATSGADEHGVLLVGGYFGTWHDTPAVTGLPLTRAGLREAGASPGAGVLVALAAGSCVISETAGILDYLAGQSAGQCGPCMFGLPAIAADFAQLAAGRPEGDVLRRLARRLEVIAGRGACRHPDGAARLAASVLASFSADAHAHAAGRPCPSAYQHGRHAARLSIPLPAREDGWE
jgi:NADH:ubiquinone oxidoreductase subunit F (NADH-binding)